MLKFSKQMSYQGQYIMGLTSYIGIGFLIALVVVTFFRGQAWIKVFAPAYCDTSSNEHDHHILNA